MTDSGKNCALKPVDAAAKMPCMRMPVGVGGPESPSLKTDFSRFVSMVSTPARHERGLRSGVGPGHVGALRGGGGEVVGAAAGAGDLACVSGVYLVGVDLLVRRDVMGLGVAGGGASAGGAASDHSVDGDGAGTGDGSIGPNTEDKRLRRGVDGEDGVSALERDGVALLIGREEGAVDEDAAVDEVEAPVARALEDACHFRSGRGFLVGGRKDLRDHLAEGAEQPVAGAGRGRASGADAAAHGALFSVFGRRDLLRREAGLRAGGVGWGAWLGVGFLDGGGVVGLLLLLEVGFGGEFLCGGLLAGGEELLEVSEVSRMLQLST